MRKLLLVLALGFLVGCATDPNAVELDLGPASLNDIRLAIFAVIGSPRVTSENQREFLSIYFPRVANAKFDPETSKERLYSRVIILGDSRPYTLEVHTIVEAKHIDGYEAVAEDRGFTNKISSSIQKKLNQSLNNRNVIDDLRAF